MDAALAALSSNADGTAADLLLDEDFVELADADEVDELAVLDDVEEADLAGWTG
jgi:hypothetical protein